MLKKFGSLKNCYIFVLLNNLIYIIMKNKILFLFLPCMCICTMLVSIVGLVMSKTHNQSLNFVYLSAISCLVSIAVLLNDVLNNKKN